MNYLATLDWMFSQLPMYQNQGKTAFKKDLTNSILLSQHLDTPESKFKSIHVAGTNGKGSTSHMIASILQEAGYKVGLYTSPHLKDFRERIKINGEPILEAEVTGFIEENKPFFESNKLSFFEMTVGLAFQCFAKHKIDIAVVEVGLGGRLDSTNIITPIVSVITNIGLDHTQMLGETLPEIAFEKAGIIKQNIPVVIGEYQEEIHKVFYQKAIENHSSLFLADQNISKEYQLDLKGSYQQKNAKTAVQTIKMLQGLVPNEISEEQYIEFYKNLSHDFDAPLAWAHNRVEGSTEYTQLLYIPAKAPHDIFTREAKAGIKLYVKRVFIMDDADHLIPNYLRFVQGVVDSADLPLNVSRELLQESRDVKTIREGNARRVLTLLDGLAKSEDEKDQEKFKTFYTEFGAVLKEGLGEDFGNRERILKLLRYATSNNDDVNTSLADYKARMKEGQKAIYYVTADSLNAAKNSPQLELFKKKGIEVLLMSERVDEWAMNFVQEFDGTPLQNVSKGAVDLGDLQDAEEKKALEQAAEQFKPVIEKLGESLKDKTKEVRVTTRLVDSPACLVTSDGELSPQLIRMLKQAGQEVPEMKPILEINPEHPLVKKLEDSVHFDDLANVIFDQAVIAEGGLPEDPAAYVKRINSLLLK